MGGAASAPSQLALLPTARKAATGGASRDSWRAASGGAGAAAAATVRGAAGGGRLGGLLAEVGLGSQQEERQQVWS